MAPVDEEELAELDERDEPPGWPARLGRPPSIVCRCHCVEEGELVALAKEGCSVEELGRRTGAGTGCTSCRGQLRAIVEACRRP